jgi:hypothetical protein
VKSLASVVLVLAVACIGQTTEHGRAFHWNWRQTRTADGPLSVHKNLSSAGRTSLLSALATQFKILAAQSGQATEFTQQERNARAAETRVTLIDLNSDGVSEVSAQPTGDICSPTGNCPFWVFKRTAFGYTLILDAEAIQTFNIQASRTNSYRDLVLKMHGSATESDLLLYEFRGGQYRQSACYNANWTYLDADGEMQDLKEPRITPCDGDR